MGRRCPASLDTLLRVPCPNPPANVAGLDVASRHWCSLADPHAERDHLCLCGATFFTGPSAPAVLTTPDRLQVAEVAARQAMRVHGYPYTDVAGVLPAMVAAAVQSLSATLPEMLVLRVQPGDVLVLAFDPRVSRADADAAAAELKAGFPGNRVLITKHVDLSVMRPEVADQIEGAAAPPLPESIRPGQAS